jgi:hypothetical protein
MADGPADIPWLECLATPVDVNISDVLDPPRESAEDRSRRCRCEAWLRTHLADRLPPTAPRTWKTPPPAPACAAPVNAWSIA